LALLRRTAKISDKNTDTLNLTARDCGACHSGRNRAMRRLLLATVAGLVISSATGCLIPMYSADPSRRAGELLNTSEDLRQALDEWERIWFLDQPSHLTPYETHGGIL
jgi:hypothetical protein